MSVLCCCSPACAAGQCVQVCCVCRNCTGHCSSVLCSQAPEPWQKVPAQPVLLLHLELGAAPVSWNVQLEITAAILGWARASALALDLCDSNGLAYQAQGVQALKSVHNMIIRNFRSATQRRVVSFSTPAQDNLCISSFHVICLDFKGFRAVTLLHEKKLT